MVTLGGGRMTQKHFHTYKRSKNKNIFRCTKPDCTHYNTKEMITGKRAECPVCHGTFILSTDSLRRAEPRCLSCQTGKKGETARKAFNILADVGIELLDENPVKEQGTAE